MAKNNKFKSNVISLAVLVGLMTGCSVDSGEESDVEQAPVQEQENPTESETPEEADTPEESEDTAEPVEIVELLDNGDFEAANAEHWFTNDEVSIISASDAEVFSGAYSGLVSGRTDSWNAPAHSLVDKLELGRAYDVSARVKLRNSESSEVKLSIKVTANGADSYIGVAQATANDQGWIELSGIYVNELENQSDIFVYIEGPAAGVDYYIDDISVKLNLASTLTDFTQVDVDSLKALTALPIGVAVPAGSAGNSLLTSDERQSVVQQHFSQISAENIMKMNALHPAQGSFNFSAADTLIEFAENNAMSVHGHVLVWHSQVPQWMVDFSGDKTAWIEMMEHHVTSVASHFEGRLSSWDVVNEAFNEDGSYRAGSSDNGHGDDQQQSSIWYQNIGEEFIERAFIKAREADSEADLYYNDYNISWNQAKLDGIVDMVQDFQSRQIPIDGVGFQMHISSSWPDMTRFAAQLQKVVDLGLKVKLTELDIRMNESNSASELNPFIAEIQKERYFDIVKTYLDVVPEAQRGGITVWGISDLDTWIVGLFGNSDWPLLFDDEFNAKPALQGFADALTAHESQAEDEAQGNDESNDEQDSGQADDGQTEDDQASDEQSTDDQGDNESNDEQDSGQTDDGQTEDGQTEDDQVSDDQSTEEQEDDQGGEQSSDEQGDDSTDQSNDSESITSLIANGDFESGELGNWTSHSGGATVTVSESEAYQGSHSALIADRQGSWDGLAYGVTDILEAGKTYEFSAWVKLANTDSATINVTLKTTVNGEDQYNGLASIEANNANWVEVKGNYTYDPVDTVTNALLYVEGPEADVSYYVDNITFADTTPESEQDTSETLDVSLLENGDFETGSLGDWSSHSGAATIAAVDSTSYEGSYAAHISDRQGNWDGLSYNLTGELEVDTTYEFSAWVKLDNVDSATVSVTIKTTEDGADQYNGVSSIDATSSDWTNITGNYTHSPNGEVSNILLYIEGPDASVSYYLDNLTLTEVTN